MKNSYETAGMVDLGAAGEIILGEKYFDPCSVDDILGVYFGTWIVTDVDESDE